MNNNLVTYEDLKCPSHHLECILQELNCRLNTSQCNIDFQTSLAFTPQVFSDATKPASGNPGQMIFISDLENADESIGGLVMWQPSTTSWRCISLV